MNAEKLNAIKERAEKATPGPWNSSGDYDGYIYSQEDTRTKICDDFRTQADEEFVKHARQDIPELVAEVERLRKEISFIAHVDMVTNAYDIEHVAVSVQSWAKKVLDGINHDNTIAPWYGKEDDE